MNIKWLPNISLNYKKKNGKQKFVRSRKRFRTITWKYTKTIGPFASFIYIFNQSIGSGLFDIPSLIDEVGWIPVIFGNLFVCSVAVFCSLMILRAMTMIPKNKNFEQRIEYSAVIKYFMSNEKYKFVSFLYHLGNLCNNICGILVISKIVDMFIIKLFGSTILFQVYPQIKVSKCSLSLLDSMYNGYYYSSTGHYETVVIGGVTIGYIINAIICIHLSSKGLEETINYQYVVFMIFMTSFLYLSVSSTIYLLSQNYMDQNGTLSKVDVYNNLILNRAHLETDLVKNYRKYKEINHVPRNSQLCKADPFFDQCPVMDKLGRNTFSVETSENEKVVRRNHDLKFFPREVQMGSLQRTGKAFSCSCLSLNPLYQKKAYVFRNNIFYFTVSSCSYRLNIKNAASLQHFYSVYKIYYSSKSSSGRVANQKRSQWGHTKKGGSKREERKNHIGGKFSGAHYPNMREEAQKQNQMFFTNLYYMISRIEGIKSYCMGKTFANFIDSYGFVSNIPSWGNEITDDVNVSKAIWLTVIFSSIFYFIFGLIFCLNNSFQKINTSVLYLFNFVAVAPKVITGSISMRYDLMNLDICSDNAAFFLGCIAPFLSAWIFSNSMIFSDAFNYTSLICGLFCNFLSPAFAYISACKRNKSFYKNPLRKYTIVNRKKTVFSNSSDIRKALGNIIDTFDDNDEARIVEDSNNEMEMEKDNYQLQCDDEGQEEEATLGYRRSLSLNRYASQRESNFSSISRSSYFKFVNGECLPKSYSKDSTGHDSLSERNSSDFKLSNNYDSNIGICAHGDTTVEQPLRIKRDTKEGGGNDNSSSCFGKKGNKKKKKKGVMFFDEIEECSSREIFKSKGVCNSGKNEGEEEDTLNSDRYTKGSHSNDGDICGETKEMSFLTQLSPTNQTDDTWGIKNSSYEILEDVNIKKVKKVKKKLMFSDEVQLCNEVDEAAEMKRKNSKGVRFIEESKEPTMEDAKKEKREIPFSLNVQFCTEEVNGRENNQFSITVNDETVREKEGEQGGNMNPTVDTENMVEKRNSEGHKTILFEYENGEETESVKSQKREPVLSSTKENEQQTGQISKKGCAGLHEPVLDNPVQESVNQTCSVQLSPRYEIRIISNNACVGNAGEKAKQCSNNSGKNCEIDVGDQKEETVKHSENEHTSGADNIKLKEKEKKGGNLLCVNFQEHIREETAATLSENINTKIENTIQYVRNFSDSAINYDAGDEMKRGELKEDEVIRKNRSFEHHEQVFKRQREKLKSHYKYNISNVLEKIANYDDLIRGMDHIDRKEINGENFLMSTSNRFKEEKELGPSNRNILGMGSTNDKSFVEDTLVEEADDTLNKENTFISFEKYDAVVIPNVLLDRTCESNSYIGKDRNGFKKVLFSEPIQEVQVNETGSFDHASTEGRAYSIHLKKENSKDEEILIDNLKDLSEEQYLNKNSSQLGQSLDIRKMRDHIEEKSQSCHFDDVLTTENSNNCEANVNMCKMNILINNTSYRDEQEALLKHSKSGALAGEKHHNMSVLSTEQGENTHNEQNSPSLRENKDDLLSFSFLNNFNKQKCASCEIISLPEHAAMPQRKMKTLYYEEPSNEVDNGDEKLHKRSTLFVRQRKKLKSSFHANGDMIIGNHKEAIHKEQINEFRKQISKESCIFNYYDDEKCAEIAQGEACQMDKEKVDQVMTKNKVPENNEELEIPILHIMKSYESQTATQNIDVEVKDSVKSKSTGDPRRKTCYKFADISKLISDIDLCEFESKENDMVNRGHHNVGDNNEAIQGEDIADHFSTPTNDTNLESNKRVNFNEEKDTSTETEKPNVVKELQRIYSALSTKLHSEDSEMCTNDDHDYTDCVDFRCFKIIDNVSPVKHYYNAFRRSKILDLKKYDHIYSNNFVIDDKTNMDHLCSIFLFGNPLERNEKYADNNNNCNNVDVGGEQKDAISDAQNEWLNQQDKCDSTVTFEDKKENISSNSGLYEEKGFLIKRSFSGSLESHNEVLKRCIFEKSDLSGSSILSRRKSNLKFSLNEEIINTEELNDIFRSNDIVGDMRKNSDKIEVMKIRIHVYPALLQKYHVETTYLLLGCLTAFSFVGIITDFLFG
ncbi:amino acid transporter, putative [Plasmodium knowlesi strain H]|uniref:Amino acid transporter, putative n=3 Tax=Plasmodium knowlesi TaxID=5850 RepID=A0A5K1UAB5_PLAKH|nr:amino acid transporter, putative [Plasmodium knowlesi strain H]OTN64250.1 putative Amino acid transporter [Plasmodium knowlesi]CAA9991103.1 amino acid transporter, putative [Plasmodium knowlesi strain H]SBO20593.1 amino acid transporter, putative [Plasmodium knowlesi strain H]SBO20989.1 amino acid transporter, putative [Plasmodium knowlesi strain H]VVS80577.1 amino acid transporter, putative [Plasmodium knowlesi strain H]|eukprot:XP_002262386.1 amino acid transporter, putative [Plasmodium knowlesi strain H]